LEVFRTIVVLFFCFVNSAFAYQFIEIKDDTSLVSHPSMLVSKQPLEHEQAYAKFLNGRFSPVADEAKSFGMDKSEYWFVVQVKEVKTPKYLDFTNTAIQNCTLYVYENATFTYSQSKGASYGDTRIRFTLHQTQKPVTYLIKLTSNNPKFVALTIGSELAVENRHFMRFSLFTFTSGVFVFALIFHLFLFFKIKDYTYIYYIVHITGIYLSVIITAGYFSFLPLLQVHTWVLIALQMQFLGLTLFTDKFLHLKHYPKLRKVAFAVVGVSVIISIVAFWIKPVHEINFYVMLILFCLLFFVAIKVALRGYVYAFYYIVATGVAVSMMVLFTLTHKGLLAYTFVTFNLLHFALIWDSLFLTTAIVHKLYQIQQDNIQKEKNTQAQSKTRYHRRDDRKYFASMAQPACSDSFDDKHRQSKDRVFANIAPRVTKLFDKNFKNAQIFIPNYRYVSKLFDKRG